MDPQQNSGKNQGQPSAPQHDAQTGQGTPSIGIDRGDAVKQIVKAAAKSGLAEEIASVTTIKEEKADPKRSPGDSLSQPSQESDPPPENDSGKTRRIILIAVIVCVAVGALIWLIVFIMGKHGSTDADSSAASDSAQAEDSSDTHQLETTGESAPAKEGIASPYPASALDYYPEYKRAVEEKIAYDGTNEPTYLGHSVSKTGFCLYDINKDKTPELFIVSGKRVIEILTASNGTAVTLLASDSADYITLCTSGYLCREAEDGSAVSTVTYYALPQGQPTLENAERFNMNYDSNSQLVYTVAENGESREVSEHDFYALQNAYGATVTMNPTPLTDHITLKTQTAAGTAAFAAGGQ